MAPTFRTTSIVVVIMAPLIAALAHAQLGWKRDHAVAERLSERIAKYTKEQSFPVDGEDIAGSALSVIRGADTVALDEVIRGRSRVVYFTRPDCAPCKWFAAQMDSILPTWRDSFVVVEPFQRSGRASANLMLDSVSTLSLAGVPTILSVDANGYVHHSAMGLGRVVRILNLVGVPSPDAGLIGAYKDSARAAATK